MKRLKLFFLFCCILQFNLANATLNFSNNLSKIVLQNNNSNLVINNLGDYSFQDDGIVANLNKLNFEESSTYTLVLDNDVILDSHNLINSSVTVQGNDHSIFLNSDWTIPALSTLTITTTLTIEGNGHTLLLDNFAQILTDTHSTLSLHNIIIKNTNNSSGRPPLAANGPDSKISFNDVKIDFKNNFWFNRGNLFIANNVDYNENTQFIYNSNSTCYILPQSKFSFEKDSTLYYLSDDINNNSIAFQAPSAQLSLDGATLRSTTTGLGLNNGQLLLKNKSILEGGTNIGNGMTNINSIKYGTQVNTVAWSPDGNYLAIAGEGPASGVGGFDNVDEVRIYMFDGKTFELTPATSVRYGTRVYSMAWTPDGKYLAIGGQGAISGGGFANTDELRIYSFNFATATLQAITSRPYGTFIKGVDWRQNGNYICIGGDGAMSGGGFDNTDRIRIYYLSTKTNTLDPITSIDSKNSDPVDSLKWSPSGNYIATGEDLILCVYYFNPFLVNVNERISFFADNSAMGYVLTANYKSITWSNDGQFILTCGNASASDEKKVLISKFDPTATNPITYVASKEIPDDAFSAKLDRSGTFLSIGGYNEGSFSITTPIATIYSFDPLKSTEYTQLSCAANEIMDPSGQILTSDWNPNSNIIAYGGNNLNSQEVQIYNFIGESTELVYSDNYSIHLDLVDIGILTVDWTYDNNFVAVAGVDVYPSETFPSYDNIRIYKFDRDSKKLNAVTSALGVAYHGTKYIKSAKWSPDGKFLAIGGGNDGSPFTANYPIEIYAFDGTNLTLKTTLLTGGMIESIDWHPTGLFLAVGITGKITGGQSMQILSFDGSSLTTVVTDNTTTYGCGFVSWDPTGDYLGINEYTGSGTRLKVFKFLNYTSIVLLGTVYNASQNITNISWTPDSKYISTAISNNPFAIRVYTFSESGLNLVCETTSGGTPLYVKFSPDGKNLVVGRQGGFMDFYSFDKTQLIPVMQSNVSTPLNISTTTWSSDGDYLAVGTLKGSWTGYPTYAGPNLFLYKINRLADIYNSYSGGIDLERDLDVNVLGAANIQINGIINESPKTKKNLTYVSTTTYENSNYYSKSAWSPVKNFIAVSANPTLQVYSFTNPSAPITIGNSISFGNGNSVDWTPDGNFIAVSGNTNKIFSFDGVNTPVQVGSDFASGARILSWSEDGNFIAAIAFTTLQVFSFDGINTPVQVGSDVTIPTARAAEWAPTKKFIAIVNYEYPLNGSLQIFAFDGINTPTQVGETVKTVNYPSFISWSPDSNYLAVSNDTIMQVFYFDGVNTPRQVGNDVLVSTDTGLARAYIYAMAWSPTESFIAIASNISSFGKIEHPIQIFSFDGVTTPVPYACNSKINIVVQSLSWSGNGQFISITGENDSGDKLQIYSFE